MFTSFLNQKINALFKWLIKCCIKKYITNESLKKNIHGLNSMFADKIRLDGKGKVVEVSRDIMSCISVRLKGFTDDGRIVENELSAINAIDDAMIDKYLSDETISAIIEYLYSNTKEKNRRLSR